MRMCPVQCPTCFEWFEVASPEEDELPADLDYDCEICCRPMVVRFDQDGAMALGLGE